MAASYIEKALAPLRGVLTEDLVEICVNPDGTVWTETRGQSHMAGSKLMLSAGAAKEAVSQIAAEGQIAISDKHPLASASFDYQDWLIRAQVICPPVVQGSPAFSLRFFKPGTEMFEPAYLSGHAESASALRKGLIEQILATADTNLEAALMMAVQSRLNIVVAGGTSSGKTTLARWLVSQVSDEERILTIEDVPDLMPRQPNCLMMTSRRYSDIRSPDKLLQASLRLRPDRIILSEVTGADAYTFLKAINTGHGGSITTIHADTAELAIERMAQTALEAPGKMTYGDMVDYVTRSLDLIIHMGKQFGRRGVMEIYQPRQIAPAAPEEVA